MHDEAVLSPPKTSASLSASVVRSASGVPQASVKTRIMIVVAGRLFRDCIQRVLQDPKRTFIANCAALDHVGRVLGDNPAPDLFVVGMGETDHPADAFASIRTLRARFPAARWIVLTRRTDMPFLRGAIETGVHGLLLEDSPGEVLQLVTELVLLGHSLLPPELAAMLAGSCVSSAPAISVAPMASKDEASDAAACENSSRANHPPRELGVLEPVKGRPSRHRPISLSDRENDILQCLVAGHSNKLIARELGISEATVKVHVKALLRKMQVANRTQAAISALQFLNPSARAAN